MKKFDTEAVAKVWSEEVGGRYSESWKASHTQGRTNQPTKSS